MLTSALRSGGLATTSVAEATPSRSPGVSSTAFRAQSPNLRFAPLMDMDFAVRCPLVRRSRLVSGFCPSTRTFVPCFLQTPPRGGSPCIITRPYLHQVGQRTFTSQLLSMPSTQRSRKTADAFARFPALSWFPGQTPTQLAMCAGDGKDSTSGPISATSVQATRWLILECSSCLQGFCSASYHVVSVSKIHPERALANASIRVLISLSSL